MAGVALLATWVQIVMADLTIDTHAGTSVSDGDAKLENRV